jgi:integrase
MTPEEQSVLLEIGATRAEWRLTYLYTIVALSTTCSNCEMRGLKLGDLNLTERHHLRQERAREEQAQSPNHPHRERPVPLGLAGTAVQIAGRRARKTLSTTCSPSRSNRGEYNPNKPMTNSGIKKPWESLREAAGLKWLRIHDLRHSAITRMAEAGVPMLVIMSIAGHVSQRMLQHYTTISEMSKRQALRAAMPVQSQLKIPSIRKKPTSV